MARKRDEKSLGANNDAPHPKRQKNDIPTPRIPPAYYCPINKQIMVEPWIAEDGFTYEKRTIENWFKKSDLSPMTGLKISNKLILNRALKDAIQDYLGRNEKNVAIQAEVFDKDYYCLDNIEKAFEQSSHESFQKIIANVRLLKNKLKIFEQGGLFNFPNSIFVHTCMYGSAEEIKYIHEILIEKSNAHLKVVTHFKWNVLCLACETNRGDAIKYLVELIGVVDAKAMLQSLPSEFQNLAQLIIKNPNYAEVVKVLSSLPGNIIPNTLNEDIQKELDLIKQRELQQTRQQQTTASANQLRFFELLNATQIQRPINSVPNLQRVMASLPNPWEILSRQVNPSQPTPTFFTSAHSITPIDDFPRYENGDTINNFVEKMKTWLTTQRDYLLSTNVSLNHIQYIWPSFRARLNIAFESIPESARIQSHNIRTFSWGIWKDMQLDGLHQDFSRAIQRVGLLGYI